jgi:hypothetical protein
VAGTNADPPYEISGVRVPCGVGLDSVSFPEFQYMLVKLVLVATWIWYEYAVVPLAIVLYIAENSGVVSVTPSGLVVPSVYKSVGMVIGITDDV